jgi:VWFA-related protein
MAALVFTTLLIPASAQHVATPAPPPHSAATASEPPSALDPHTPILHANANLVLVDVVVTDRQGNAVHGLEQRGFHLFENGHEQEISVFSEQKPGGTIAVKPVALPPHTYSNIPVFHEGSAVNVLLLDGLNTPVTDQMEVRRQMLQYMGTIAPGTSMAIFTLSSRLRMVEGFTTDVAELAKALSSPNANVQTSVGLDPGREQDLNMAVSNMATMSAQGSDPKSIAMMQQFEADLTADRIDQRMQMTMDAMQQLALYLGGIPGRKNLIWFSGSFPLVLSYQDALQSPFSAVRNYADKIRQTSEMLSAARVAVYPVDAHGLMTLPSTNASIKPAVANMTAIMAGGMSLGSLRGGTRYVSPPTDPYGYNTAEDDKFLEQTMQEQASMQQIAQQTGGKAFVNTNGLKEAAAKAVEDGSSYYTIGYVPSDTNYNGQFRKIKLRVSNGGYTLAYRDGYYAYPPDKPTKYNPGEISPILAATLHGAPSATQILFDARVLRSTDPLLQDEKLPAGPIAGEMAAKLRKPVHRIIVDMNVDPHELAYVKTPNGVLHARVEFTLVAYDMDGKRLNYLDGGFQLNLSPKRFAEIMSAGIPARLALDLPPEEASLRIAVHDLESGRVGSLEIPLTDTAK